MKSVITKAKHICDSLKDDFGDNLSSVNLYGSAARGEYVAGSSDINLLLVFRQLDKNTLKKLSAKQKKYSDKVSLINLTQNYIETSTDSFPVELLDMKLHHSTLTGFDILEEIIIKHEHLRIQLEREFKAKLTLLRQGLIIHGFREKDLIRLMYQHLPALAALFQGIIYIENGSVPEKRVDLYKMISEKFNLNPKLMEELFRINKKERQSFGCKVEDLFFDLIEIIEKLSNFVDYMDVKEF